MGVGSIFVATTLAPLVVVFASISLQILTIGLEQLRKFSSHSYSRMPLYPVIRKINFLVNSRCFGDMEIDVKSFSNVLLMAILMGLIGVALSLASVEETAKAARGGGKSKTANKAKKTK